MFDNYDEPMTFDKQMMFNKLFWGYDMLMMRRWDAFEMLLFWDAFEMLIEMFLRWFEMLLTWVLLLHSWLCRIHCIFEMELMLVEMACIGEFWDEGLCLVYASINWQIFKMEVLLQWYHMHLHSIESHYMIA